jgi:hypothetical protein
MKTLNLPQCARFIAGFTLAAAILSAAIARANVYATDIKVDGNLTGVAQDSGSAVSISYILNEPATAGVTVKILQGSTVVASFAGTANRGLNTVSWLPSVTGTYSVSVTAGATGFSVWTQTSLDSTNNVAVSADGIAVDSNTNSPYYGRIMLGCDAAGSAHGISQLCGIYKMNADGSPADEGSFGYGGYTTNDLGNTATGQMASGGGFNPWKLRIGDDDRLYADDYSDLGAIIAFDMKVTTNQLVINEAGYANNPDYGDLSYGINNFDVTGTTTTQAAVWLCDLDSPTIDSSPNWGIWVYHLKNGAADPADTKGIQAVISSGSSDLNEGSSGGCMVDTNQDIFVSQDTFNNISQIRSMEYTNWNHGTLPSEGTGSSNALGTVSGQVHWGVGGSDVTFEDVQDTVINNRQHPTMVALPMEIGNDDHPGIRVLSATTGSVITVTSTTNILQTLTNLDYPNSYTCAAWDNVGNLYGASASLNYWRVFSPPGANQSTTAALATVQVNSLPVQPDITSIAVNGSTVTINFTGGSTEPASAFAVIASPTIIGTYTNANAVITGSSGSYQATTTVNGIQEFYRVEQH